MVAGCFANRDTKLVIADGSASFLPAALRQGRLDRLNP